MSIKLRARTSIDFIDTTENGPFEVALLHCDSLEALLEKREPPQLKRFGIAARTARSAVTKHGACQRIPYDTIISNFF